MEKLKRYTRAKCMYMSFATFECYHSCTLYVQIISILEFLIIYRFITKNAKTQENAKKCMNFNF